MIQSADRPAVPFELAGLANATRYQEWIYRTVAPFLGRRILEIGAGIGNMSKWLPVRDRLILTESDPSLLNLLRGAIDEKCSSGNGKVSISAFDVSRDEVAPFFTEDLDTIVSFNVLEHIENDEAAMANLCRLLRDSNSKNPRRIVTFVPAHAWAFGGMDRTFGHFRRYSRSALGDLCRKVAPDAKLSLRHFNTIGLAGWVWNGRILGKEQIGNGALAAFEKICPIVSPIDDFIHEKLKLPLGQSLLAVMEWK